MGNKDNVIDMMARRREQLAAENKNFIKPSKHSVLDMTERRQEVIKEERRLVRRTILSEFIGAYAVLPEQGLAKVSIFDISDQGMAIDLDSAMGHFREGEEIAMRIYLSNDTFMPFIVRVYNFREVPEEGVVRHGVAFLKETMNNDALQYFVRFLESVSASLKTDSGDVVVTKARR